ncbi:hypothetical protein ACFPK9_02320 [Rubritalea spongiae]|uniref:Uncharacterized protein n=1 Tax=Rubritalea spongiae TaxID=430797 RepID=A0ABW5E5L1_9BACT
MDEKPQIKTVRVRISVDEKASSQKKAGLMQNVLSKFAKKMGPPTAKNKKQE